jgi:hypothetical protein
MRNMSNLGRGVALAALLAVTASPALAEGKGDRAQKAIAEARGKVDAAERAGTTGDVPGLTARANAALRAAEEDVREGHKVAAIQAANRASELADTAIGVSNKQRDDTQAAMNADAAARTDAARQQAAAAQDAAAAANARADTAQQQAAAAQAQADALRNQPPVATVTTTETTKHVASAAPTHRVVRRVITHPVTRSANATERTTTTTVSTAPPDSGY